MVFGFRVSGARCKVKGLAAWRQVDQGVKCKVKRCKVQGSSCLVYLRFRVSGARCKVKGLRVYLLGRILRSRMKSRSLEPLCDGLVWCRSEGVRGCGDGWRLKCQVFEG